MAPIFKAANIPLNLSSAESEVYKCDDNIDFLENLLCFFGTDRFCDVTLTDGKEEVQVKAHRLILAARSEYLAKIFNDSSKDTKSKVVKLEKIDGKTLQMVISFMYSNTIQLESDTVENVLNAAHILKVKPLEDACYDFLTNELDALNLVAAA